MGSKKLQAIRDRVAKATEQLTEVLQYGDDETGLRHVTYTMPLPDFQLVNSARADIPEMLGYIEYLQDHLVKWQPIETAPEDGFFLVANGDGAVCISEDHDRHFEWAGFEATHWMPLPAPPEAPPDAE